MSVRFLAIGAGIFVTFWVFGLLQEKLFKGTYGPEKERFTFVMTLLSLTTVVSCLYSYGMLKMQRLTTEIRVPAMYKYAIALTYLLAMISSQMALKWVSYPAQVIAKSAKPIPVLVMGVLLGNKSYHFVRYLMVMSIVAGIVLFMYRDDKATNADVSFGIGELLLVLSLLMDGVYNSLQERVMSKYPMKSDQFMFDISQSSMLLLAIALVFSGEVFEFVGFVQRHPIVVIQMLTICFCAAFGQFCIYKCITEFGTLTCSIVTTTRKFFTVLSSIVIFGHVLFGRQWVGIVLVFGGLVLDIYYGKSKKSVQK